MKSLIGLVIRVYRKTPLYPNWGGRLAKLLNCLHGKRAERAFVHDLGRFKISLFLGNLIDSQLYYTGHWEPDAEETIRKLVHPDDVCLDVGANIGYFTLTMAAAVGPSGKVIAFEPTTYACRRLKASVELNDMPQIELVQAALGDHVSKGQAMRLESAYRLDGSRNPSEQCVDVVTLDSYLAQHPVDRLDFIKIDTDGMEQQVICGATETLKRYKPIILFEVSSRLLNHGGSPQQLLDLLLKMNYHFYRGGSLDPYSHIEEVTAEVAHKNGMNVVAISDAAILATKRSLQK